MLDQNNNFDPISLHEYSHFQNYMALTELCFLLNDHNDIRQSLANLIAKNGNNYLNYAFETHNVTTIISIQFYLFHICLRLFKMMNVSTYVYPYADCRFLIAR